MEIVKDDEWGLYPNFSKKEMACKYTGKCFVTHKLMKTLQDVRDIWGKSIIITSGYRDVSHPVERDKVNRGEHTYGLAADIKVSGTDALALLEIMLELGVQRIGVNQKGNYATRFLHVGVGDTQGKFKPAVWSY